MIGKDIYEIGQQVERLVGEAAGSFGIHFLDLSSGERFQVLKGQEEDVFEAASMIKLWIMSAAYEKEEAGEMDLAQKILLKEEDMMPCPGVPDHRKALPEDMFPESGVLNYISPGSSYTVEDLIRLMILISDNTATNILIDLVGKEYINEHIRKVSGSKTRLVRKLFEAVDETTDETAIEGGTSGPVRPTENRFSLKETAEYFRKLYREELVSEEASRRMCAMLQNQQNTYKIPFYIRRIPIAHKTGEDLGIENDGGIIFAERPYVLCFASNGAYEPEAVRICQDVSRIVAEGTASETD